MIEITIVFLLGWFIGSLVTRIWLTLSFREILKDLGVTEQQLRKLLDPDTKDSSTGEAALTAMEIKIEEVQGTLYAYRLDNNQFLGQGPDRDQLIERLKENLTNVRLIITEDNGAGLLQKNNG